jgi:glutathione peroxidase
MLRDKVLALAIGLFTAFSCGGLMAQTNEQGTAYDYAFRSIDESALPFASFRGKVVLVVNTASFCGFTRQYSGLQRLYETYQDRGLVVLGVPSNDFGEQEPGTEQEIKAFCQGAYNVTFPLTSKYHVVGAEAHPFYTWAAKALGSASTPRWNFHKYLVGADGRLIGSFSTQTEPDAKPLVSAIEKALADVTRAGG